MQESAKYKLNSVLIILLGAGIFLYIGIRAVFPEFSYFLNESDKFRIQILKEQVENKHYLAITPFYDYPYNKVKMKIKLSDEVRVISSKINVYKDYMAQLYPTGGAINSQEELRQYLFYDNDTKLSNGTLFSYNDAIYFVSKGKRRPFLGPEVFTRLNYDWDNISAQGSQFVAAIPEDEKIHFISAHPDGTILETEEGALFLIWNKKRLPIQNRDMLAGAWSSYYTIKVDSNQVASQENCEITKQSGKTIECSFVPTTKLDNPIGHTYLFELPKDVYDSISDVKIVFSMLGQHEVWFVKGTLRRVWDSLYLKYAEYIF